jgi:hypothetical protein
VEEIAKMGLAWQSMGEGGLFLFWRLKLIETHTHSPENEVRWEVSSSKETIPLKPSQGKQFKTATCIKDSI